MEERKFALSCRVGRGWSKTKSCEVWVKFPSFDPALSRCQPLPIITKNTILSHDLKLEKIMFSFIMGSLYLYTVCATKNYLSTMEKIQMIFLA